MSEHLPWQDEQWQSVSGRLHAGTLPHALLLAGPAGLGKRNFAQRLAQAALCERRDPQGDACGRCRACTLYLAHNHPDLRVIVPPEPGKAILVDQIREAIAFLSQTAQFGGFKVLIIDPAEAMNINAANSLLKTLEEPAPYSLLMLVSARPTRLSATIVSRCQRLAFTVPSRDVARQWLARDGVQQDDLDLLLALSEGAPLRAAELREESTMAARRDVLQGLEAVSRGQEIGAIAERLCKHGLQPVLHWVYHCAADILRLHAAGDASAVMNRDVLAQLAASSLRVAPPALHRFLLEVERGISLTDRPLNPQLQMESLLMTWQALFTAARSA